MEENKNETVKTICDLGLNKVVPEIYDDALKPASKEVGKSLLIIAKTISIALTPLCDSDFHISTDLNKATGHI